MKIALLGHAAVLIESRAGRRLLIDPYESGGFDGKMAYAPITDRVDAVVCTHQHADHCAVHTLPGAPAHVEEGEVCGFRITRHRLWHDEWEGRRFGGEVSALRVEVAGEGVVVHLSDVGHSPGAREVEALRGADVLCVPVGGFFTIGAAQAWEWCQRLESRMIVPMHYKTGRCGLELEPLEVFLGWASGQKRIEALDRDVICVDDFEGEVVFTPIMRYDDVIPS